MKKINRRRLFESAMLLLIALLAVAAAAALFSATRFTTGAFEFTVQLVPLQRGDTVICLPPVGELSAATHRSPFLLKITLLNIDLDLFVSNLESLAASGNRAYFETQLREKLGFFLLRLTILSSLCAAGIALILPGRRKGWRALLSGVLAALLFITLFSTTLAAPYDLGAFNSPSYKGILEAAPWVVGLADQALATLGTVGERLELMTTNLQALSQQLEQVTPPADSGIRVLHVSDIHNNPAAFNFIEKVVASFQIDLIIDTGDLTDYGTELETEFSARFASLPVPYLFVPGNHDSPRVLDFVRREGVIVLDGAPVEVGGLRVAGIADPSAANLAMETAPEHILRKNAFAAARDFATAGEAPDVLAVHHPLIGEQLIGKVPLILSGHTHRASFRSEGGSILVNAGTAGAAGVRGLHAPEENPYSVAVLYFNYPPEGRPRLVMADLISVQQFKDSFSLSRYYNR